MLAQAEWTLYTIPPAIMTCSGRFQQTGMMMHERMNGARAKGSCFLTSELFCLLCLFVPLCEFNVKRPLQRWSKGLTSHIVIFKLIYQYPLHMWSTDLELHIFIFFFYSQCSTTSLTNAVCRSLLKYFIHIALEWPVWGRSIHFCSPVAELNRWLGT